MKKFLSYFCFFVYLTYATDFLWNDKLGSILITYKNGLIYTFIPEKKQIFIYQKDENNAYNLCLDKLKVFQDAYKIPYETTFSVKTYKCSNIYHSVDLELGLTNTLILIKTKKIGISKKLHLKKAQIKPKQISPGRYYWYGLNYFIETTNETAPSLTPIDLKLK